MTMTSPSRSPSRRERLRTATVAEIKDLARRLLVGGGPPAISLRAIARDMGMTAPAIYRYFPSLDALVAELTEDLYDELRETIEAARDPAPATTRARARRDGPGVPALVVGHPAEFGLMFGNPVPGVRPVRGRVRRARPRRRPVRGAVPGGLRRAVADPPVRDPTRRSSSSERLGPHLGSVPGDHSAIEVCRSR